MFSATLLDRLRQAEDVCVLTGAGISAESGNAFLKNPALVWEWYTYRKKLIHDVKPNPAHEALVALENRYPHFAIVTQNVDSLHSRAGSRNVIELHGNIERSLCVECRRPATVGELEIGEVPRCETCGSLVRPDVVWFGEALPAQAFGKAQIAAEACQVFVCVGTSGVVYPAAFLPLIARREGAYVVEINAERTELSAAVHESLVGKAEELLPRLVSLL